MFMLMVSSIHCGHFSPVCLPEGCSYSGCLLYIMDISFLVDCCFSIRKPCPPYLSYPILVLIPMVKVLWLSVLLFVSHFSSMFTSCRVSVFSTFLNLGFLRTFLQHFSSKPWFSSKVTVKYSITLIFITSIVTEEIKLVTLICFWCCASLLVFQQSLVLLIILWQSTIY